MISVRGISMRLASGGRAVDVLTDEIPQVHIVETAKWETYWRRNPVEAWIGGRYFALEDDGAPRGGAYDRISGGDGDPSATDFELHHRCGPSA